MYPHSVMWIHNWRVDYAVRSATFHGSSSLILLMGLIGDAFEYMVEIELRVEPVELG